VTPTFVDDLAEVFDYCINERPQGVYHAVGSSFMTDYDMALNVQKAFDLPGTVRKGELMAYLKTIKRPYQKRLKVSNQKLTREFNLKMHGFVDALAEIKDQFTPR
jgi:dTDP-4-dehydrorhamnose reductase